MDLKKFEMQETGFLHLKDAAGELMYADGADGEPDLSKPMRIEAYGPGSKEFSRAQSVRNGKQLRRLREKGKADGTAAEMRQDQIDFLAACTKGFENFEGEPKDVYGNQKVSFIRDQFSEYLNETENFKPASSTS